MARIRARRARGFPRRWRLASVRCEPDRRVEEITEGRRALSMKLLFLRGRAGELLWSAYWKAFAPFGAARSLSKSARRRRFTPRKKSGNQTTDGAAAA